MYLRYTTRKKDGKVHRYWRLVRSVRVGRRVIQQTVAQLGELDEQGRLAARALAGASDRGSGAGSAVRGRPPGCGGAGTPEGGAGRALAAVRRRVSGAGPVAGHGLGAIVRGGAAGGPCRQSRKNSLLSLLPRQYEPKAIKRLRIFAPEFLPFCDYGGRHGFGGVTIVSKYPSTGSFAHHGGFCSSRKQSKQAPANEIN